MIPNGCLRCLVFFAVAAAHGQGLAPLKMVVVPEPPGLDQYVRDRDALLVLGKALFWDMQVGSDGRTACATCHFHAGADHRVQNQLSNPNGAFEVNHSLIWDDFPFRKFTDSGDAHSAVQRDSGQRAGSAGVFRRVFTKLGEGGVEAGADSDGAPEFRIGDLHVRQVTPRHTPSVINAALNVRQFWDGRASDIFTGRTPFGDSDTAPNVVAVINGQLVPEKVRLSSASLASQAVGPPVNAVEMSYEDRTWPEIGKKLLAARPLASQQVAADDSVLGPYAAVGGRGLRPGITYLTLVQTAFQARYWDSVQMLDRDGRLPENGGAAFTVAELNFPLFFALAIEAYESTLLSGETRFDQFEDGKANALTAREKNGFFIFQGQGNCMFCHSGPELTNDGFSFLGARGGVDSVLSGVPGSLALLPTDTGFAHTGVRPPTDDSGLDGTDDFGLPFSTVRRQDPNAPLAITGAFKIPGLRNVEFTGPYFHNGGQATLEQVVDFYNRGGDFPDDPNLPVQVRNLGMNALERSAVVEFLKSMSDDRVRFERAPFDHPEICVPTGYAAVPSADPGFPLSATDRWAGIPAVGRNGNTVPLQTFEELLRGVGTDGTRAHTMSEACTIP